MVFESVVVNLVNTYLGKYIKDLDSSNLHLGIWRGDVVLNNLTLKDDALAELDLPIEVKSGYIGKLSAEIPWSNIYTKPVVVKIEDVFVLATPVTEIDYDAEQAEERLKAVKRRKLQAIEKSSKPLSNESSQESQLPDSYAFVEKLTSQIIKNVQVFIKNIHIRYEDKVTTPGTLFAVGITLKHFTAETTDEFWKPCVVDATEKKNFKLVSLDSFAVYWNTDISSSQYGGSKDWQLACTLVQKSYCHSLASTSASTADDKCLYETDLDRGRERQLLREVWVEDVVVLLTKTDLDKLLGRQDDVEYIFCFENAPLLWNTCKYKSTRSEGRDNT